MITNVRNVNSNYWMPWLSNPAYRCVVPTTAFSKWKDTKPKKTARWFALNESQPLFWPAILTTPDEIEQWLTAPIPEALELQRPLPDDGLVLLPLEGSVAEKLGGILA